MSSFSCPLCVTNREFTCFGELFQHITLYHQNDSNFAISCDLYNTCGVLYRTFSAYKSHVYRQHSDELYSKRDRNNNKSTGLLDNQQDDAALSFEQVLGSDDDNDDVEPISPEDIYGSMFYEPPSSLDSVSADVGIVESINDIKRAYVSFLLQLREELLLPKTAMNVITTYIVTLLTRLQALLEKQVFSSSIVVSSSTSAFIEKQDKEVIEFVQLKNILNDISDAIGAINKNEYQFIKNCEKYFDYTPPEEIIVSHPNETLERGYYIPIEKTLSCMLNAKPCLLQILENIQQQQTATENDPDLMFSIRDGYHGGSMDHDRILIQLYLDDIGLTNPIGSKRDQHKMSMMYLSLEDLPDQCRSKVDFIQLIAICNSKILKVK